MFYPSTTSKPGCAQPGRLHRHRTPIALLVSATLLATTLITGLVLAEKNPVSAATAPTAQARAVDQAVLQARIRQVNSQIAVQRALYRSINRATLAPSAAVSSSTDAPLSAPSVISGTGTGITAPITAAIEPTPAPRLVSAPTVRVETSPLASSDAVVSRAPATPANPANCKGTVTSTLARAGYQPALLAKRSGYKSASLVQRAIDGACDSGVSIPVIAASTLRTANYDATVAGSLLKNSFSATPLVAARVLLDAGYEAAGVAQALRGVYALDLSGTATVLREVGLTATAAAAALVSAYAPTNAALAGALRIGGYTTNEIVTPAWRLWMDRTFELSSRRCLAR
jgi:hypothetical protein